MKALLTPLSSVGRLNLGDLGGGSDAEVDTDAGPQTRPG